MRGLLIIFLQIVPGCLWLLTLVSGITFLGIPGRVGRLVGSEMRTDTVKNVQQCKILCEHQSRCKSFNYNVKTGECTSNYQDLLTANQPDSLDAHSGLVFSEKRLVGQVMILVLLLINTERQKGIHIHTHLQANTNVHTWFQFKTTTTTFNNNKTFVFLLLLFYFYFFLFV